MTYPRMPVPQWAWRARLVRVKDGDTLKIAIDRGFADESRRSIRLLGLNAAEHGTPAGDAATAYVAAWLTEHASDGWLVVCTRKPGDLDASEGLRPDKYGGRYLGIVYAMRDGACLNADLIESGHALPWDGRGVKPV